MIYLWRFDYEKMEIYEIWIIGDEIQVIGVCGCDGGRGWCYGWGCD